MPKQGTEPFSDISRLGVNYFHDDYYVDQNAYDTMVAIRSAMLANHPFWGFSAMDLYLVEMDSDFCPTALTDGFIIGYNKDLVNSLPMDQCMFLVCHEVYHNLYDHVVIASGEIGGSRFDDRGMDVKINRAVMNQATDHFINLELKSCKIGSPVVLNKDEPFGGICMDPKFAGMASDEIYFELIEDWDDESKIKGGKPLDIHIEFELDDEGEGEGEGEGNGGGQGNGEGEGEGEGEGNGGGQGNGQGNQDQKNHGVTVERDADGNVTGIKVKVSKKKHQQRRQQIKDQAIQSAISAVAAQHGSDSAGSIPAGMKIIIDAFVKPKKDWRNTLRNFVSTIRHRGYSFNRPDKKTFNSGIIIPGYRRDQQVLEMAVSIDASGSIGIENYKKFFGELMGMLKGYPRYKVHVFCFDTKVDLESYRVLDNTMSHSTAEKDIMEYIEGHIIGGGGTIFDAAWQFMEEQKIRPRGHIMFTDGYPCDSNWQRRGSYCPSVFVVDGNVKWTAPFGRTVHLED